MEYKNNFEINEYLHRFDEILCEMSNRMLSFNTTSNITINFIECMIPHHEAAIYITAEMIPHHEGAVEMCNNLLRFPIDPRLRIVANNIIKEQSRGIIELKQIQKNL